MLAREVRASSGHLSPEWLFPLPVLVHQNCLQKLLRQYGRHWPVVQPRRFRATAVNNYLSIRGLARSVRASSVHASAASARHFPAKLLQPRSRFSTPPDSRQWVNFIYLYPVVRWRTFPILWGLSPVLQQAQIFSPLVFISRNLPQKKERDSPPVTCMSSRLSGSIYLHLIASTFYVNLSYQSYQ